MIDDFDANEWERIADMKKARDLELTKSIEKQDRLLAMPFYKRIQEPGEEDKLKEVEKHQKEAFMRRIKLSYRELADDKDDLFADFMVSYLKGKVKNILEYLELETGRDKDGRPIKALK